ncbi:MAG: HlyD family efflux transporter periplasmic adaptor subunit [Pseudomonadales bacterium]|jgi:HlyD family secretion protein|nr:HlyD family efflux transporter periplasmic adaptor subunit [Pseudomonadales bacterium]
MGRRATLWAWLMLAGCGPSGVDYAVGTLERERIELVAETAEPLLAFAVEEGDEVDAGALLLRQDPARARLQLARAEAELARAEAAFMEARHGPRSETVAQARARLEAAEAEVATVERELARASALLPEHFATEEQVDLLEGRRDAARARRDEARSALEELRAGTRSEVLAQQESARDAAAAAVAELALTLSRSELRAPVDAVVESLPLEPGERPQPGQTVVVLRATGRTFARIHVPEPLRAGLEPGAAAEVRVDGRSEPLEGRLRWISGEAAFTPYYALTQHDRSRLSYLAEVDLTGPGAADLPVGVPVEVRFPQVPNLRTR